MGKGGGGGASIPNPWTILLGSNGSTISIDSDLDNIRIKEFPALTVNSNLAVTQPIVTDSKSKNDSTADVKLAIEPLKVDSDSRSSIDMKPVAVDSCQTIKLAPLPPICLEQPYSQHFGFTFMGIELWGFTMSGKSEMNLHSPPKVKHHSVSIGGTSKAPCLEPSTKDKPARPRGGLRVRIGGKD